MRSLCNLKIAHFCLRTSVAQSRDWNAILGFWECATQSPDCTDSRIAQVLRLRGTDTLHKHLKSCVLSWHHGHTYQPYPDAWPRVMYNVRWRFQCSQGSLYSVHLSDNGLFLSSSTCIATWRAGYVLYRHLVLIVIPHLKHCTAELLQRTGPMLSKPIKQLFCVFDFWFALIVILVTTRTNKSWKIKVN